MLFYFLFIYCCPKAKLFHDAVVVFIFVFIVESVGDTTVWCRMNQCWGLYFIVHLYPMGLIIWQQKFGSSLSWANNDYVILNIIPHVYVVIWTFQTNLQLCMQRCITFLLFCQLRMNYDSERQQKSFTCFVSLACMFYHCRCFHLYCLTSRMSFLCLDRRVSVSFCS